MLERLDKHLALPQRLLDLGKQALKHVRASSRRGGLIERRIFALAKKTRALDWMGEAELELPSEPAPPPPEPPPPETVVSDQSTRTPVDHQLEPSSEPAPPPSEPPPGPQPEITVTDPAVRMSVDEIVTFYKIEDPVYRNLVYWRVARVESWFADHLRHARKVLEIGTGQYPFTLGCGSQSHDIDFVALEPSGAYAARAREHVTRHFRSAEVLCERWSNETITAHGWENAFDVVTSFEVFEHIPAEAEFTRNAYRVLKPGGFFILETPNTQITPLFVRIFGQPPDGGADYEGSAHVNELGFRQLFQTLRRDGFEVVDFDCYYLPIPLWQDHRLAQWQQEELYKLIHTAAGEFPFYSYVQCFLAKKL